MQRSFKLVFFCSFLLLAFFTELFALEKKGDFFIVMESLAIQKAEEALKVREKARELVLKRAVQEFVLKKLPETGLQASLPSLLPLWQDDVSLYVREFEILASLEEKNNYRLVAKVFLDEKALVDRMKELGLIFSKLPALLFMLAEQGLEDSVPKRWWDKNALVLKSGTHLTEALSLAAEEAGFSIIWPDNRNFIKSEFEETSFLDIREAQWMGALFSAPVVLAGCARVLPGVNQIEDELRPFLVEIDLIAIDTESGLALAEVKEVFNIVHEDFIAGEREALYQAGRKAARVLLPDLKTAWLKKIARGPGVSEILLDIRGENYLSRFVNFRKVLAEIEGLVSMERREMRAGSMTVLLRYKGSASEFASELLTYNYKDFSIKISDMEKDKMRIDFLSLP